jgi:hypothetical protein
MSSIGEWNRGLGEEISPAGNADARVRRRRTTRRIAGEGARLANKKWTTFYIVLMK